MGAMTKGVPRTFPPVGGKTVLRSRVGKMERRNKDKPGCKLCDEEASIPGLVIATFGYWWQMPVGLEASIASHPQAATRRELENPSTPEP